MMELYAKPSLVSMDLHPLMKFLACRLSYDQNFAIEADIVTQKNFQHDLI